MYYLQSDKGLSDSQPTRSIESTNT